jgi:hypothetical protein
LWKKENPGRVKVSWTKRSRKLGHRSFDENKECSSFLGVHVAERVLSCVFKDVERTPMNTRGYDFVCNRGKRIDVKSACLGEKSGWSFHINHNIMADFFLCLAFDDRENLTPLHVWLLPGKKFNHLVGTKIRPSTVHKWDEYKLDIERVFACCNEIRSI